MDEGVVLLYTIHDVFGLQRGLEDRGIQVKPIPTPRHLSSDCGTALRFVLADLETVRSTAVHLDVDVQGIHEL
jgi:hypothetical protein